jgi:PhnB protein
VSETSNPIEVAAEIRAVPEGYRTVTPWIISKGTAQLLDFVKRAFGAEELTRVYNENGTIGHVEFRIGDSVVMALNAQEGWSDTPGFLRLYVEDGDAAHRRALEAGTACVTEMTNLFFGDRVGRLRDPQGNLWWIHTRIEDVDPEEQARRAKKRAYIDAMQQVQESLDRELRNRTRK